MNGARVPPTSLSTNVETQHIGRWGWINTHTHARAFACTRAVDVFEWGGGAAMRRIAPNATSIEHGAHALLMPNVCCVWSIGVCVCVCLGGAAQQLRNSCTFSDTRAYRVYALCCCSCAVAAAVRADAPQLQSM